MNDIFIEHWTNDIIKRISDKDSDPYLITLHWKEWFTDQNSYLSRSSIDRIHSRFNSVHRHISSLLMKNHMRKLRYHPFAIASADMPGTRYGTFNEFIAPPHIHALMLIERQHKAIFKSLLDTDFQALRTHPKMSWMDEMDVKPIGKTPDDIRTVLSYDCKFDRFADAQKIGDFVDIVRFYPMAESQRSEPNSKFIRRGKLRNDALRHSQAAIRRTTR